MTDTSETAKIIKRWYIDGIRIKKLPVRRSFKRVQLSSCNFKMVISF